MLPAAHTFAYVDTDIPDDMTIADWRRTRVSASQARRSGRLQRLRRRAVGLAHPAPALRPRLA